MSKACVTLTLSTLVSLIIAAPNRTATAAPEWTEGSTTAETGGPPRFALAQRLELPRGLGSLVADFGIGPGAAGTRLAGEWLGTASIVFENGDPTANVVPQVVITRVDVYQSGVESPVDTDTAPFGWHTPLAPTESGPPYLGVTFLANVAPFEALDATAWYCAVISVSVDGATVMLRSPWRPITQPS